ncbi:MAG: hypothetical protein AAF611_23445 [Bacteroidota bacterium]
MKHLTKALLITFLSIYMISCSPDTISTTVTTNSFDYSLFNSLNQKSMWIKFPKQIHDITSILEKNRAITNHINSELGVNLNLTSESVENAIYTTQEIIQIGLNEGFFEDHDSYLITELEKDFKNVGFKTSIQYFERNVLSLNMNPTIFEKYNTWANILKIINSKEPNIFTTKQSKGCFTSILAYSGATVAVGLACTPNPTTPASCPLAISLKALAYYNMIEACKD